MRIVGFHNRREEEQDDRPTDYLVPSVLVVVDNERELLVECKSSTLRFVRINDDATGAIRDILIPAVSISATIFWGVSFQQSGGLIALNG